MTGSAAGRSAVGDAEGWHRAIAGDGAAFGVLFDRHRPRVQRHLHRLLTSPADVEDAVAIVFLEAWRRRHAVRLVDDSLVPWLLVTGTNVANNVRRGRRRYQALLDRLPEVSPSFVDAAAYEGADALGAMRRLSLTDQQVLTLCVLEEWSEREAAAALQVRPGTVKSRLHRAKKRLADQLGAVPSTAVGEISHGI